MKKWWLWILMVQGFCLFLVLIYMIHSFLSGTFKQASDLYSSGWLFLALLVTISFTLRLAARSYKN